MADLTPIWDLPQPELGDAPPDVPRDVRALAAAVDSKLTPVRKGLIADRPPAGKVGQSYIATDQNNKEYLDIGVWIERNPVHGFFPGDVKASFQTGDHGPWLYADGRNNIPRAGLSQAFIDLMLALGYPGADGTKIGIPDFRGRMIVNRGTVAEVNALGKNENVVIGDRRPRHSHNFVTQGHFHGIPAQTYSPPDGENAGMYHRKNTNSLAKGDNVNFAVNNMGTTNESVRELVSVGPQLNAPSDGPAFITANGFIFSGAVQELAGGVVGGDLGVGPPNVQAADYTLALADAQHVVEMDDAAATVVTIPANADVAFLIGTIIEVARMGAGAVTLHPDAGVVIKNKIEPAGIADRTIADQVGSVSLRKRADDEWVVVGDLA